MATGRKDRPGVPGIEQDRQMSPELQAALMGVPVVPGLTGMDMRGGAAPSSGAGVAPSSGPAGHLPPEGKAEGQRIGPKELQKAVETLTKYKQGKANLEARIVEDELWWELRHWEAVGRKPRHGRDEMGPRPTSGWLFNAILNKHADAMDNYPEPVVLPRERSDEGSAKVLSEVLPVLLEQNDYEQTYSDNWWEKLKHGTAAYGVFWNPRKENGLGDVDVRAIDLLKLFWEPGVTDIQQSRNLFIVELVDEETLEAQYPQHRGRLGGSVVDVKQYLYDDTVDTQGKSVVVDWYYKVQSPSGRTVLHYAKFVGDTLLFASENEPEYRERGWYDHGLYPVVLDVLFPEKGTPAGFGYVAICKDPQLYIDRLSANILENAMMTTKKRFFVSGNTGVNEDEFLDWNRPLVHVEGELSDSRLKEIVTQPLNGIYVTVLQQKIEEMKDTAANRDVNAGGTSNITAAAAIAALQEAGNKSSRDMIAGSYRAYVTINTLCIELIRQFYDEARSFRITGEASGQMDFVDVSNADIREQYMGMDSQGTPLYRRPVFDLKIKAQKKNPFSRMEQNERAKELYGAGFFNPERAQEALGALEMMEFEGKDKVMDQVRQGETLMNLCRQMSGQLEQLSAIVEGVMGGGAGDGPSTEPGAGDAPSSAPLRGAPSPQGEGLRRAEAVCASGTRPPPTEPKARPEFISPEH